MKRTILTLLVATLCLVLAGPELGVGLELLGLLDLLGVELFLFCFSVPILFYWFRFENWLYRVDPYFFLPSVKQVQEYPGLVAHSIPGYVVTLFWVAGIPFIAT